jgi:hypothetical protein
MARVLSSRSGNLRNHVRGHDTDRFAAAERHARGASEFAIERVVTKKSSGNSTRWSSARPLLRQDVVARRMSNAWSSLGAWFGIGLVGLRSQRIGRWSHRSACE